MTVKWYAEAVGDLDKIYNYYEKLNPRAAAILYNKFLDAVEILKTQPYASALEQTLVDFSESYRSLIVENYKLVYFIKNDTVLIVQVFDCRQAPLKLKRTTLRRRNNPN